MVCCCCDTVVSMLNVVIVALAVTVTNAALAAVPSVNVVGCTSSMVKS